MQSFISQASLILMRCPRVNLLQRGPLSLARLTKLSPLHNHPRRHIGSVFGHEQESGIRDENQPLITLAIETSCDDTCVAILEKSGPASRLLFNKKITADSREHRGIVPTVSVESHSTNLAMLIKESLNTMPMVEDFSQRRMPDFISVTRGPGMKASLGIGLSTAKGLAVAWDIPLLGIHHMQAHALTPRLISSLQKPWPSSNSQIYQPTFGSPFEDDPHSPQFPYLTLLVSGGHTQIVLSESLTKHSVLADCLDVALGDVLDKCARVILPSQVLASTSDVMFGAALEKFAFPDHAAFKDYRPPATRQDEIQPINVPERGWSLTAPLHESREMGFNFTGLGGTVRKYAATLADDDVEGRRLLARVLMKMAFEHVASRIVFALTTFRPKNRTADRMIVGRDGRPHKYPHREDPDYYDESDPFSALSGSTSSQRSSAPRPSRNNPEPIQTLVLSGGVASNKYLGHVIRAVLRARGFPEVRTVSPPPAYCTDNAAMIAWTGMEMYERGWRTPLDVTAVAKWSLDPKAAAARARRKAENNERLTSGEAMEDGGGKGIMDGNVYQKPKKAGFEDWLRSKGKTEG